MDIPVNNVKSLAIGADLNTDTWADFVARLRHDCVGEGVRDHYTADAIFIVQANRLITGLDTDYCDKRVLLYEDSEWFSPVEYYDSLDDDERASLDENALLQEDCGFLDMDQSDQWEMLTEMDEFTVTGCDEQWEFVNSHFTKDAAEAFIRRKKHDYPRGLRVYVDAQVYCWEYNAIKAAILDGRIGLYDQHNDSLAAVAAQEVV